MFTGLVSDVGEVVARDERGQLIRFRIACAYDVASIEIGASIACSGPCLTAVAKGLDNGRTWFEVDVGAETLERTSAGGWQPGVRINLERSLKIGDELGGHIVTGHVDGIATITKREAFDGMVRFDFRVLQDVKQFIAEKGSVSLDGTSLTVNSVADDIFSVLLIPHTVSVTTWQDRQIGDLVNLEVDLMARYAARLTEVKSD